jgi:hypothetical protein
MTESDVLHIKRKQLLKQIERKHHKEDRELFMESLATARDLAQNDETLLSALKWIEVLTGIGCHASFALQAWTGWQYRQSLATDLMQ